MKTITISIKANDIYMNDYKLISRHIPCKNTIQKPYCGDINFYKRANSASSALYIRTQESGLSDEFMYHMAISG